MFDFKESAARMMTFIKKVETEVGPRLPGSPELAKSAELIKKEYESNIGLKPVTEPFKVAPMAGVGGVFYIGVAALINFVLFFLYPLAGAIGGILVLLYAVTTVFIYTNLFDALWPKKEVENFYTVQEPRSGKTDFTIILGAHYDSSWHWTLQYKKPKTFIPKIIWGVVGVIGCVVAGFILTFGKGGEFAAPIWENATRYAEFGFFQWLAYIFPIVCLPGIFFLTQFLTHDKSKASPGAMDNLTGIALNMEIAKYYNEHPEELPEGCRLVATAFTCEESGLKGSFAFVKQHKNDDMLKNAYALNIDSISDYDYFEVVTGDPLQFAKYDPEMIDMLYGCLEEVGCIRKTGKIVNPIGGNDATPLHRAGVKAVTFAAQNPVPTSYYHTCNDKSDRLREDVFAEGLEVVHKMIGKICAKESAK